MYKKQDVPKCTLVLLLDDGVGESLMYGINQTVTLSTEKRFRWKTNYQGEHCELGKQDLQHMDLGSLAERQALKKYR